ncbi:hypothetical protein EI94DRAFT_280157 [Lactarius quietus]|nr:hypothetical protein EI94DRAFT_280157 [Lactarius quietus]
MNVRKDNFDESRSETFDGHSDYSAYHDHGEETMGESSSGGPFYAGSRQQRKDFDDGANSLWSLYGNVAKTHDQARFSSLAEDMDAVGVFAGLFSGVLASFLVQSIPNLQVNPADQSVYYQNQSAYYQQQSAYYLQQSAYYQQQSFAMLAQVSQQIASVALHVSIPSIASPSPPTPLSPPSHLPSNKCLFHLPSNKFPSHPPPHHRILLSSQRRLTFG